MRRHLASYEEPIVGSIVGWDVAETPTFYGKNLDSWIF